MATTSDLVAERSLPLDVVVHNATVILSGVLLGAILAFVTLHLGWLRHHLHLNDRLVDMIFPLGTQLFFFALPLWCIVAYPVVARFSELLWEYVAVLEQLLVSSLHPTPDHSIVIATTTIHSAVQMATSTPTG